MINGWSVVCPACREASLSRAATSLSCACGVAYDISDGVWQLLGAEERERSREFLDAYTRIRRAEGRVSDDPAYYRALPDCAAGHPLAAQWRFRARSLRTLLAVLRRCAAPGARVLDLGAGTGWLSNRLAEAGYQPCAVDLSADPGDGLGAARHYAGDWPRIVADFDRLPLADGAADATVFNASFHYSTDYAATLAETLRVTKPGGTVLVLDTPVYSDIGSGRQMLAERAADFERRFGERSDSRAVEGFLTRARIAELGRRHGLDWRAQKTWRGPRWFVAPLVERLRGRREPPAFDILWAVRPADRMAS
jgi:SAM-dependent methyltransferase